jgi:phage head maturation protease
MTYVLQGTAFAFDEPFVKNDYILYVNSGAFDASLASGKSVQLLIGHDPAQRLGSSSDRLTLHAGKKSLVFRFDLHDGDGFADLADDPLTYLPVSISHRPVKTTSEVMRGVKVVTVIESELVEISLIKGEPDIKSSYARVVSQDGCASLKDEYDAGLFNVAGRLITAHRALKARENGGEIKYRHTTSAYDRAAERFTAALRRLQ